MANGGGLAPAPARGPPCPTEKHGFVSSLLVLLRQMDARVKASAVERERLLTEIELLKREQSRRMEIAQDGIQKIRGDAARAMSMNEKLAELLGSPSDPNSVELGDNNLECFSTCISTLAAENAELKKKLKEGESHTELAENTVDHQHSAKDTNADVRKLKQAYKTMVSEKDKDLSALRAENSFVWYQLERMEKEYKTKLEQTVHEFQLAATENDEEIRRLRAEVVSTKDNMLIIQKELEQMHALVKGKDIETGQLETSQKLKKDLSETNRKSKVEGPVSRAKSRICQVTPARRDVKTSRKSVSSAKGTQNQSGKSSRMHSTEGRGQSETSQKRKRGSSLSHGNRRCSTRLLQVRTATSPVLFTPCFTIPKLTAPTQ